MNNFWTSSNGQTWGFQTKDRSYILYQSFVLRNRIDCWNLTSDIARVNDIKSWLSTSQLNSSIQWPILVLRLDSLYTANLLQPAIDGCQIENVPIFCSNLQWPLCDSRSNLRLVWMSLYKGSAIVNYGSRVIIWYIFESCMTLESQFTTIRLTTDVLRKTIDVYC